jgi:micrococcal nuclease
MDTDHKILMQQASDLFNQGNKEQAAKLLAQVINDDPGNAKAWYGMALSIDDIDKKRYCLKKALELKPGNRAVIEELQKFSRKPKPRNNSVLVFISILSFLCVASLLSIAGFSYLSYLGNKGNNNQGAPMTATIDPALLSQIVGTQYAVAKPVIPPTALNPTTTAIIVVNAAPTQTLIPNTEMPTVTTIPTLSIVMNETTTCVPQNERVSAIVTRIIDGDTIEVAIGETTYHVRYIGIDSPEGSSNQEDYGMQATQKNKDLVLGKKVVLIKDVSETDQFDRLLRYVFVDNLFVNYELVALGNAKAIAYEPDIACHVTFSNAEILAHSALLGLWAPAKIVIPTVAKVNNTNCDPAYPTVCIAPYPPDLDCKDIPYHNFQVLSPDPHDFDHEGDGIGCEN